jgi:hypothetical protein
MAETLAILAILTLAAACVGYKLWRAATGKEAGCPGCSLSCQCGCGACPGSSHGTHMAGDGPGPGIEPPARQEP